MLFTSFGCKWRWDVTWFVARASWLHYNTPTKQAKMAKLSQRYQNLKKSYLWPTGSNFGKQKAKSG